MGSRSANQPPNTSGWPPLLNQSRRKRKGKDRKRRAAAKSHKKWLRDHKTKAQLRLMLLKSRHLR